MAIVDGGSGGGEVEGGLTIQLHKEIYSTQIQQTACEELNTWYHTIRCAMATSECMVSCEG